MPAAKQRVLMLEAPRQARFADVALPSAGPDDVIVRSRYSTFKHGTEMMAYLGRSPLADMTFNHELRLFETEKPQDFYPRPMGNMVVGAVEWAGRNVRHLRQGQLAFGWAPIADVHVMRASNFNPLGDLTAEQALCIDPASFALGAVIDGAIGASDCVLVTGLGAIGLFVIQYCVAAGATVIGASSLGSRRQLAAAFGACEVHDPRTDRDLPHTLKERMGGVDVAIECSGNVETLNLAIRATCQCGRVVCVGFYADPVNLGEEFYHNRLTLLASLPAFSWNNPVRSARPLYAKDLQEMAANDFRAGKIRATGMFEPIMRFEEAERAVQMIADAPQRVVKLLLEHE